MNDDSGDAGSHGEDSVAEEAEQAERELNVASNPQEEAINNVVFAGLMSGYPDGRFHPEGTLTRAQLASIVNKTFNLKQRKLPQNGQTNPEAQMTDVPARYWAAADIRQVLRHNIMEGYREGVFHPNQPVSRAEALAIFAQAYGVYQYDDPTVVSILSHYPDAEGLPGWSRKAMATALQHGFVNAQQGEPIHPMQPMTRGDMAYTLNEYLNRLHPSEKPTGATTGNPTKK